MLLLRLETSQKHFHNYMLGSCSVAERDAASGSELSFMVRWVVGSIFHDGPIELFLVPASVPRLM